MPALAGIYTGRDHLRRVVDVPDFRKAIYDVGAARGTVGLSLLAYDMQSFVFKAPVAKVADFSGKRIRVLASEGEQSAIAALGGSSVPMSLPEVLPALQQGTIDGVNSVLGVFVAFRYHDAATNLVDTALWPILSVSLISKVWFDRLPPDLKKIVLETGSKVEPELGEMADRAHRDRHQGLDRQGRQDRQAFARRPGGGGPPRVRRGADGGRKKPSVEGVLRPDQGCRGNRELMAGRGRQATIPVADKTALQS